MMEHSKAFPDCFYRVTIKGLCVREGKVLLVHESKKLSGQWEMPGGGLDFGEDARSGLEREVREETGLKIKKMSKSPIYTWTWKYENKRNLEWYYSLVVAYRIEFENLDFIPTDECEEIRFFSKDELQNLKLCEQAKRLIEIFDPKDFEVDFIV